MPVLRAGWLSRSGRYYAWAIALFYAVLVAMMARRGDMPSVFAAASLALAWISWAGGLVAWASARDLEALERTSGLEALAVARAVPSSLREPARVAATMGVVASAVLFPSLLVSAVALGFAPTQKAVGPLLLLVGCVVAYGVTFGVTLGAIARWSARLSARHARLVFSLIVFLPAVADVVTGSSPSVLHVFDWMLDRIRDLGDAA
jgi:hypothetical protein